MFFNHFGVGRSQIECNMKVKIEISICTGLMLNDHSNPYIESTIVLSDATGFNSHTVPQTITFQNSLLCLLSFYGNMMCAIGIYYIPK